MNKIDMYMYGRGEYSTDCRITGIRVLKIKILGNTFNTTEVHIFSIKISFTAFFVIFVRSWHSQFCVVDQNLRGLRLSSGFFFFFFFFDEG